MSFLNSILLAWAAWFLIFFIFGDVKFWEALAASAYAALLSVCVVTLVNLIFQ